MNLLLINYEYPPIGAGAGNATWHIACQLVRQGCKVVVLTSCYGHLNGRTIEDQVIVYRCPALRRRKERSNAFEMASYVLSASFLLPPILRKEMIQGVVVFFSFPSGPLGLLSKWMAKTPYIISLRGGDVPGNETALDRFHQWLCPLRRHILRHSLAIVANSMGLKILSQQADPFPVQVIPNGVDVEFFRPKSHVSPIFRFLFAGRFQAQKNLFFLLQQMDQLAKSTTLPFELHLVGGGVQKKELISFANLLSIKEKIKWHGWCDKETIRHHYQMADCLVNPSLNEGMPNAVLEAMACGLPVIASNVMGNNSIVRDGQTGFLFELDQHQAFQQALRTLLEDKKLGRRFGASARKWVEACFSWETVARGYLTLFQVTLDKAI